MPKRAKSPIPEGMHTVTPHLWFNGKGKEAVEFYRQALGAECLFPPILAPDGKGVMHAMIKIGDSSLMLADAWPDQAEQGPKTTTTAGMWLYVPDADKTFEVAVKHGCRVVMPMMDAFWGDRMGKVQDPFGHVWAIATNQFELTPEEMSARQKEFLASCAS